MTAKKGKSKGIVFLKEIRKNASSTASRQLY